jgi:transcriptional regulator with XRE-family HTH domain
MDIAVKIKQLREEKAFSQEALAEKLHVTRQAVSKWESGKGCTDIENLIGISNVFGVSLDELIKNDTRVVDKVIVDNASKKWHILVMVFLVSILIYIAYFALARKIWMIGFGIATIFMLVLELRIFFRKYVHRNRRK